MSELSEFLNNALRERGMTQADVARKSGLSTGLVAQVFSGSTKDPRLSTALAICQALNIGIDEAAAFLGDNDD